MSQFGNRSLTPQTSMSDLSELPEEVRGALFADPSTASIPIFKHDGVLNAEVKGVSRLQFSKLAWYYALITLSWRYLILLSLVLYLAVVAVFTVVYYVMCQFCGAEVSWVTATYFVVVSISANGGYMGEDVNVLYPGHRCFAQRTYLVMAASYTSILLGALIATVFIAKASMHSKLQHRVVFSDYVTLNMYGTESFRMTFRIASIAFRPMVHGNLRLYVVSMQHGPRGGGTDAGGGGSRQESSVERKRRAQQQQQQQHRGERRRTSTYLDVITPEMKGRARRRTEHRLLGRRGSANNDEQQEITLPIPSGEVQPLGRMQRRASMSYGATDAATHAAVSIPRAALDVDAAAELLRDGNTVAARGADDDVPELRNSFSASRSGGRGGTGTGTRDFSSGSGAADYDDYLGSSSGAGALYSAGDDTQELLGHSAVAVPTGAEAAAAAAAADVDEEELPLMLRIEEIPWSCDEEIPLPGSKGELNLWFPSTIHHVIDADSPLYYLITGEPRPTQGGLYHRGHRHFHHLRTAGVETDGEGSAGDAAAMFRPRSSGVGEPSFGSGVFGEPGNRRSSNSFRSADGSAAFGPASSPASPASPPAAPAFQIVAVFEATDAATSTIVESKHVYTPDMLIAHYHFACPTLLTQKLLSDGYACAHRGVTVSGRQTTIDFFRFNELVPDDEELERNEDDEA